MTGRLPLGALEAQAMGLIDDYAGPDIAAFHALVASRAATLAANETHAQTLADKRARQLRDEHARPLAEYRAIELEHMRLNFYGFDPSYHVARHRFVHRTPQAWTPLHLARHRQLGRAFSSATTRA
jgi:putative two-component system hydrogenase maturation factor HypX/HoxX